MQKRYLSLQLILLLLYSNSSAYAQDGPQGWRARSSNALVQVAGDSRTDSRPSQSPSRRSSSNDLIWKSNFETGDLSEWSGVQACTDGVSIVTNPIKEGQYAAKFTVS